MRHPYEKFIRTELVTIILSIFVFVIALIKSYLILIYICFYLLVISLLAEAMIAWFTQQKERSVKQLIRGMIIFLLATYLLLW